MARILAAGAALIVAALLARPALALACDDMGNLAYTRGEMASAAAWFDRGLSFEPGWRLLREDLGRSLLDTDPAAALADFKTADCGSPCVAEEGDAQIRLGNPRAAVDDFLAAHAVDRVAQAASKLASAGRFDDAIALEDALLARLGQGMLAQADLASAYFSLGDLNASAAAAKSVTSKTYGQTAIASYRRASALAPFNEGYLLSLGFAELRWGDRTRAKAAFDRVLELHPQEADAQRGLKMLGVSPAAP